MSVRATHVACIVTILLGIIQPLSGQVSPGISADALAAQLDSVYAYAGSDTSVLELDSIPGVHSFYPDLLLPSENAPQVLLVVPLSAPEELLRLALTLSDNPAAALLVAAPRHELRNRAYSALAPSGIADSVPRVLLRTARRSEWIVSVPGSNAPLWIVQAIRESSDISLSAARLNLAHLNFGRLDPELELLLQAGIPAVRLDLNPEEIDPDRSDGISRTLRSIGTVGTESAIRREDRSFFVVPGNRSPILSESILVWSIAAVAIAMIAYAGAKPRRVRRYGTAIRHQFGLLILLFLILWLSLVAANLALRLLLRLPNVSDRALILIFGKLTLGFIVLASLFRILHPRIGRPSTAFTGAAILFLVLGAVVSALFSLPIGAYFVLMTIFGFLFSLTPRPPVKAAALLCTLLPGLYLVLSIASIADTALVRAFLTPPVYREVLIAIFLYPVLLMFFRLDILTRELPLLAVTTMVSIVGVALIAATIITVSLEATELNVSIRESYTQLDTGEVVLSASNVLPGSVTFAVNNETTLLCERMPCTRDVPRRPTPFEISIERSRLLDRTGIAWRVDFAAPPRSMQIRIDSDRDIQLYASDIPSRINPVGAGARRFLLVPGLYPPDPASGEIVVRTDGAPTRITITVAAEFEQERAVVSSDRYEVTTASHLASWSDSRDIEIDGR